jgi:hypothetical protein
MTLDSNLRYRVVGVDFDLSKPRAQRGLSCDHTWTGFAWGKCPRCGDVAAENSGDKYHWLDRKTQQPLTYKNGDEAQFDSLDEAIDAFVKGRLTVERNEVLK